MPDAILGRVQRPFLQYAIFVAVLSLVVGGLHYYLWQRLVRAPDLGPAWQRAGGWAAVGLALATPAGMFVSRALPRRAASILAGAVYTWIGVAFLLFFFLLASEIVRTGVYAATSFSGAPLDAGRRTFLSRLIAGAVGALAVTTAGSGAASALGQVAVKPVRVALARLPASMAGYKIVQLTDLHIGPTLGGDWLADIVARVNALEPDAVVITGDLVDGSVEELREHVAPLARLSARHGVFFVTGNHEYYSGVDEWLGELGRLGVRVLRNERVTLGDGESSFDLAGVDDWSARRRRDGHGPDLARALDGRDASRALVLLAHQPKQILEAAALGVGLQLSGHTHGGQIFPWGYLVKLDQPYVAGLARHGEAQIYVSRGTGYWGPPMRVGSPAEITLIELEPAAA